MRKKKKIGFFSNSKRLLDLIFLAKKHGLIKPMLRLKKDYKRGFSPKETFKRVQNLKEIGKKLRLFFEDAGPTFIKFGQLLSLQVEVLPKEIYEELEKLQDNVPGFSYEIVEKIIEEELELPINEVFEKIYKKPIAAASLAQIHRAKLKTGEVVVIKVQRPGIERIIERDIALIKFLVRFINTEKINLSKEHLQNKVIAEFEDFISLELDFRIEGRNMIRVRKMLKDDTIIPAVYPKITTKKMLIMEWVNATKITNIPQIEKWGLDKDEIASKLVETYLRQVLKLGVYHADPHPANIGVTKKGKIVLFDWGVVGSINKDYRDSIIKMIEHMLSLNAEGYLKEFLKANKIPRESVKDFNKIVEEIEEILENYNKSVIPDYPTCAGILANTLGRHNLKETHKYVLLTRTIVALNSVTKIYNFDDRDSLEVFKKIAGESLQEDFSGVANLRNVGEQIIWANKSMRELLENPKEYLEKNIPDIKKKKEYEGNNELTGIERYYRSFGIYKYPFISILMLLIGFVFMQFYPEKIFYGYSIYLYFFYASGITFFFSLFYIMYLDYTLDKRIEIYKYPFYAFMIAYGGFLVLRYRPGIKIFEYPAYWYLFIIATVIILYSIIHLVRILQTKLTTIISKSSPF